MKFLKYSKYWRLHRDISAEIPEEIKKQSVEEYLKKKKNTLEEIFSLIPALSRHFCRNSRKINEAISGGVSEGMLGGIPGETSWETLVRTLREFIDIF